MFGDKKQMQSSRYHKSYTFKHIAPRKSSNVGMYTLIVLMVLVAALIVALIAQSPY